MPNHRHMLGNGKGCDGTVTLEPWTGGSNNTAANGTQNSQNGFYGISTGSAGNSESHNNIQPYIVRYMWKRTK